MSESSTQLPPGPGRPPRESPGVDRWTAVVVLLALGGALLLYVALTTPWRPLGEVPGAPAAIDVARDFTAAEIARSEAYHRAVRLPAYLSWGLVVLASLVLGLTRWGSRLCGVAGSWLRPWWLRVLAGALAVTVVVRLVALPFDAWVEDGRRDHGLSTRTWGVWLSDSAIGLGVSFVITALVLIAIVGLARRFPRRWWASAAAFCALLVISGSYAYPLLVEPLYNRFEPMRPSELRTSLVRLAEEDGLTVDDVLVADASRRTTSLNAYVSGLGPTRRIVVYDTMLRDFSAEEVELVVAHELEHARRNDVLHTAVIAALGSAAGIVLLALALDSRRLRARTAVGSAGDPRVVALVLALVTAGSVAAAPVQQLVSRRIEARADVHALDVTQDAAGFARMQRRLAVANRSDLSPPVVAFVVFATHPTAPQRIGLARSWAHLHGAPPVPPLVSDQ